MSKKRLTLVTSLFMLLSAPLFAQLRGIVTDKVTGEPLTGAVISISNSKLRAISGLDGSFAIKGLSAGEYKLTVTMISFESATKQVKVAGNENAAQISFALERAVKTLENVTVRGRATLSGNSDASARQIEKSSDNVLNVLSSRTIELAPDVTVANVLRRVSGVTVDRGDDGEGRYPVIRGMDKRYNYTLVNGIKIPSPDDKNRYVPMDIFPSEMLQRLEVIKALTPDMEGDAIGGVMNLVMKEAPEHFTLQAQGALGYSQMLFNNSFITYNHSVSAQSPTEIHGTSYTPTYADFTKSNLVFNNQKALPNGQLGFTIGNRYFHNKLGVIISTSLQSTDRISKETFFLLSPQPDPIVNASIPEFTDAQLRNYFIHEDRLGLHTKIDYRFNQHNSISLYSIFMQLNSYRTRFYTDSTSIGRTAPGLGNVKYDYYSRNNLQNIYNATLQGKHAIVPGHLLFDWSAVYSSAGQKTPDKSELILTQNFQPDASGNVATPPTYLFSLAKTWQHNSDNDIAGYINLHYKFKLKEDNFDIGVGGMARHKERSNFFDLYTFKNPTTVYSDIYNIPVTPNGGTPQSPNIFSTTEDIAAGYGEIRWQKGKRWNVLGGLRVEHTYQNYTQTAIPDNTLGKTGVASYYDLLPSVHIKYNLNGKSALHLSYFSSISRPGFFEVVPYQFPGDYYTETGNYNLHHTKAYNFDARYELFPGLADQVLIGAFYKKIDNPIEYVYDRPATSNSVIQPKNIGTAINFGGEIVYTKYFSKFGISANYTYTHSRVTVDDKFYYKTAGTGNDTTVFVSVQRPLQGQAENVGNISLLYKDAGKGTELQVAAIYTGKHIVYASPYYGKDNATAQGSGLDYWQRGNVVVDLSGEQKLSKHFALYFKVTNLLNTADITDVLHSSTVLTSFTPFQDRKDRILVDKKNYGQGYLIGFKYHL
jgi:outer membrane cobalamin receptor